MDTISNLYTPTHDQFMSACKVGNRAKAQWIYSINHETIDVSKTPDLAFRKACGNIDMIEWLLEINPNIRQSEEYLSAFCVACARGHTSIAQRLLELNSTVLRADGTCDMAFYRACMHGRLETAKWLLNVHPNINISTNNDAPFYYACSYGHLDVAKWLIDMKPNILISAGQGKWMMYWVCTGGHLEMAKWLLDMQHPNVVIGSIAGLVFYNACGGGRFEMAKWLLNMYPAIDISADDEIAFRYACGNGHLKIAQWLFEIKPDIDVTVRRDMLFRNSCRDCELNVAKWLRFLRPNRYTLEMKNGRIANWSVMREYAPVPEIDRPPVVEECPICYEHQSDMVTSCGHQFCRACVDVYLDSAPSHCVLVPCPYCRCAQVSYLSM